jgi:hypothetical protein
MKKELVLKLEEKYILAKIKLYLNYIKECNLDRIEKFNEITIKLKDKNIIDIVNKLVLLLNKYKKYNLSGRKILMVYLLNKFSDSLIKVKNELDNHMIYWCNEIINLINKSTDYDLSKIINIFDKYDNVINIWLFMDKNRLVENILFNLKENKDLIKKLKISNTPNDDILLYNAINYNDILLKNLKSLDIDIDNNNIENIIDDYKKEYSKITNSIKYNYLIAFVKKLKEDIKNDNKESIYLNLLEICEKLKIKTDIDLRDIVINDKLLESFLKKISDKYKLDIIFDKPENYIPEFIIKINSN